MSKFDCGVRTTNYPAIANAPLPAEGPSGRTFSNKLLIGILVSVPFFLTISVSKRLGVIPYLFGFFFVLCAPPILITFWTIHSSIAPRLDTKAIYPNQPTSKYITFKDPEDQKKYQQTKIPMKTFQEMYFNDEVAFNGDVLEALEYRHDWASFRFTVDLFRFIITNFIPEVIIHSRSQDEEQVQGHYDRGDDFYAWFLGPRMIYTSGVIGDINRKETLEEMQDNKLRIVCEKINLKEGETLLDIGCGWGTLSAYASSVYGAKVTGITLGKNQTKYGNNVLEIVGTSKDSRILNLDYRDIPRQKWNKITCLEMAEHVGVRKFVSFLEQVYDMLEDDGTFLLQIAGLRKPWQYEDLVWGLFMNKYIFPGADASTPLNFFINGLESAGFEVRSVDNNGVHYSATIHRWYENWISNKEKVEAKYGSRWYRIWTYFLAYSTIISRQGSATVYQIVCHKNINAVHRVELVPLQNGLKTGENQEKRKTWVETLNPTNFKLWSF